MQSEEYYYNLLKLIPHLDGYVEIGFANENTKTNFQRITVGLDSEEKST